MIEETTGVGEGQELDSVARVRQCRKEADEAGQSQWREDAREWYAFTAGDQWKESDRAALEAQLRAPVSFNRVGPMVDSVAGSEVNNRQQVQYIPRTAGDKGLNEVLTGAADYVRDNCDASDEESDAFVDAVICGVGCTETRLDYEEDPEGQVLVERRDPMLMRWDPAAKKRNLMDRGWQQYDAWMSRDAILDRWPDAEINPLGDGTSQEDGDVHDQSLAWLYQRDRNGYDRRNGKLRVTHQQWFELESFYQLLDPATQQIADFSVDEHKKLQERAKRIGMPPFESVKKTRRKYKQVFVCGATELEAGDAPCNRFSFHFITSKRDRNKGTWYGIVKPMIDPQKWANKFFSQILHIVNTNAKGGLLAEESAIDNVQKFKEDWAKADSVTIVNDGALSGGQIQPKTPPLIPQSLNDMLQFSISSMRDVTGINLEMLGMADRQQAGVLESQRKQAAMTVLASLFDGLRRYRKEQGRTLAAFIVDYMSDGRLVRIVGGDGVKRYVPLVRDQQAVEYDVVVDEAPASVNQKERTFAMLMQMLPNLQQMGLPFSAELLEYSPLPAAMVEKWKQLMDSKTPNPQAVQQMQEAIQVLHQQLQQANAKLQSKESEIAARLREAEITADADLRIAMNKAKLDADSDYQSAIEKAQIDAQTAINRAVIDAQAKVAVAQVTSEAHTQAVAQQQPSVIQMPESKLPAEMAQFFAMLQQMGQAVQQMQSQSETMAADLAQAKRKPKRFDHVRGPNGIERSIPVFED